MTELVDSMTSYNQLHVPMLEAPIPEAEISSGDLAGRASWVLEVGEDT
jgi:hypothetical protein